MASFKRETIEHNGTKFRRLQGDMVVELGVGDYNHLQALAQSKADGLFYPYVAGDENKGVIAGLFTGEDDLAVKEKELGNITTFAIVGKSDIKGIDWETDNVALTQLKVSGVIVVEKIEGTEEA